MKRPLSLATLLFCMLLPMMTEPALAIVYVRDQSPTEVAKDAKRQDRQQKADFLLRKFFKKGLPNEQTDLEKMAGSAFGFAIAGLAGFALGSILSVWGVPALALIGATISILALVATIIGLIKGGTLLKNNRQDLSQRALFRAQFAKISGWVMLGLYALSLIISVLLVVVIVILLSGW